MSVKSGFYNSLNGDRKYDAEQMSAIFEGIISNGVFKNIGSAFEVKASEGNMITVGTGRAWFNHRWVDNDAPITLVANDASNTRKRYDAVVIEVDRTDGIRAASIKILYGPTNQLEKPTLTQNENIYQVPIAYILRTAGSSAISQSDITYNVGTEECPYVTAPLEVHSIESIVAQWHSQFLDWMNSLDATLSGDTAADLTGRVLNIENQISTSEINRSTFRGKNLGSTVTDPQRYSIMSGNFSEFFIGDYWEINGIKWRIADFNYWYGCGDTSFVKPHVIIVPDVLYNTDGSVYKARMVDSIPIREGYASSEFYTTCLPTVKSIVESAFPGMVLTHREYLIVDVWYDSRESLSGGSEAGAWRDSSVELLNELMVYGCHIQTLMKAAASTVNNPIMYANSKTQLALFALRPDFINAENETYWLRDTAGASTFATVAGTGEAGWSKATSSRGIRPVFAIG